MYHLDQSFLLSSEQMVQEQRVSTPVDSVFWNYHQNTLDGQQIILWTKKIYIIIKLLSYVATVTFLFLVPPRTTEELKKNF